MKYKSDTTIIIMSVIYKPHIHVMKFFKKYQINTLRIRLYIFTVYLYENNVLRQSR